MLISDKINTLPCHSVLFFWFWIYAFQKFFLEVEFCLWTINELNHSCVLALSKFSFPPSPSFALSPAVLLQGYLLLQDNNAILPSAYVIQNLRSFFCDICSPLISNSLFFKCIFLAIYFRSWIFSNKQSSKREKKNARNLVPNHQTATDLTH